MSTHQKARRIVYLIFDQSERSPNEPDPTLVEKCRKHGLVKKCTKYDSHAQKS